MVPLAPLFKFLECVKCKEVVMMPFKSCQQGHLVCNECNEDSPNNCPSPIAQSSHCNAELSMDNLVSMKKLLEALAKPCRHAENGCKEMVDLQRNYDHEKYCGFRPSGIACGMPPGEKNILVRDTISCIKSIKHLQRIGNGIIYQLHEGATTSVSCGEFLNTNAHVVPIIIKADGTYNSKADDGTMLFFKVLKDEVRGLVLLSFHALFIGKPVNDVCIRVTIEKDDTTGSTYILKAAIDGETDEKLIKGARAILHRGYINEFIIDDTLKLDYEIFKKPTV